MESELIKHTEAGLSWWTKPIRPDLLPFVRSWSGYEERTPSVLRRREYPNVQIVLIFEFAPPIRIYDYASEQEFRTFCSGFVAGLHDRFTLTEHPGYQCGFQVNLTLTGASRFFGLPLSELTGKVLSFADLFSGSEQDMKQLNERLGNCPSWENRFALIERILVQRILNNQQLPALHYAIREIENGRRIETRDLADEFGYSQKHLITLFKRYAGVTPTQLRRIARFDRFMQSVNSATPIQWSQLADSFGYYDQSHLINEFKQMTGLVPSDYLYPGSR